jgi:hypothetical protein
MCSEFSFFHVSLGQSSENLALGCFNVRRLHDCPFFLWGKPIGFSIALAYQATDLLTAWKTAGSYNESSAFSLTFFFTSSSPFVRNRTHFLSSSSVLVYINQTDLVLCYEKAC